MSSDSQQIFFKRSLGQNFLIDPFYQRKIVEAALDFKPLEAVLEIGPGQGALTQHFLRLAPKVILIEKDDAFCEALEVFLKGTPHELFRTDALKWNGFKALPARTVVAGNLPYNVATHLLLYFLMSGHPFLGYVFMLQKEVAQKCQAVPHHKNYNPLSVICQLLTEVKTVIDVPPAAFKPKPNVDSRVLCFVPRNQKIDFDLHAFFLFLKKMFSQRRKILKSRFSKEELKHFDSPYLTSRAEELSVEDWVLFYKLVYRLNLS